MTLTKPGVCSRKIFGAVTCAIAFIAFLSLPAAAQNAYPNKPVRIVVGMPAGSFTDLSARWMADELEKSLGATFVVENKPGAGTNIASAAVASASGDGYTLLLATNANTMNPALFKSLPFDTVRDFKPVAMIASTPFILIVRPDFPARNIKELVDYAKASPGKINIAATGKGTGTHLAVEMLQQKAGIKVQTIFYKGSLESITDVMAGRIDAMFSPITTALPQMTAGSVRALAITSPQRSDLAPNVPTVAEAGVAGYAAAMWTGLFAPAATPPAIVDQLAAAATKATAGPVLQGKIKNGGGDAVVMGGKDFNEFVQTDLARWRAVVEGAGIQPD